MTKRIEWVDLTRASAILLVVLCHASHGIYQINDINFMENLTVTSQLSGLLMYSAGRIAVPLFLMISGYLLLKRHYDSQKTLNFWSKNCKHLFICCVIWCVIYEIFEIWVTHNITNPTDAIAGILFLKPLLLANYWFIPLIIGLYVLIPFVSKALEGYDLKVIIKPVMFFTLLAFIAPFIISILKIWGIKGLELQISLGFSGGMFGIYMVIGYLVKRNYFKKIKSKTLILTFIASFAAMIIIQMLFIKKGMIYTLWYDSVFLLVSSVSLFELASRIRRVRFYSAVYFLSKYSFAVYLIHILLRNSLLPHIQNLPLNNPLKVIILFVTVAISSYILAAIIAKIPYIGKYILYIR